MKDHKESKLLERLLWDARVHGKWTSKKGDRDSVLEAEHHAGLWRVTAYGKDELFVHEAILNAVYVYGMDVSWETLIDRQLDLELQAEPDLWDQYIDALNWDTLPARVSRAMDYTLEIEGSLVGTALTPDGDKAWDTQIYGVHVGNRMALEALETARNAMHRLYTEPLRHIWVTEIAMRLEAREIEKIAETLTTLDI